jgi:hypothetical protein
VEETAELLWGLPPLNPSCYYVAILIQSLLLFSPLSSFIKRRGRITVPDSQGCENSLRKYM